VEQPARAADTIAPAASLIRHLATLAFVNRAYTASSNICV
jgi:hypothetical protein